MVFSALPTRQRL